MERQFFVITFPPENFRKMTLDTPDLKPSDGIYTDKMDVKLWKKYAEYLGKQNKLTQRGDTDFSSIQDKTVTVKVHLNENECKFVDGLGIKESDFSCKNKMVVDVPASKFEKLSDLDFVESIKLPSADEIVEEEGITFPDNGEPSISEQSKIDSTTSNVEQATITMNAVLADGKCDQLEKLNATSLTKCDSNKMEHQFLVITFPPENFWYMFLSETGIVPVGGSYSDKMDYQLWAKYAGYLAQQNKLAQRGDTDFSSIQDKTVTVKLYLNENKCKFVDGLGIKESDFSCKNKMVVDVPPSKFEKLSDLDFVESIKLPYADEILEVEGITFPDNGEPSISEQSKIDSTTSNVEQATITMNVVLINGECDLLEKLNATSLTKCDSSKMDRQFLTITFLPENFRYMGYDRTYDSMKPSGGAYTDKMSVKLWEQYAEYLGKQNKLIQRGDTDFSSIKDNPVKVKVHLNENKCQFVDGLGIKESDFSCKNKMFVDVPPSKLEKLADLDFVTNVGVYMEPNWNVHEDSEPSISERNPIEPTTIESDTQDYTSYLPVLIIIPVFVVITLFWRLRKKAKIEV